MDSSVLLQKLNITRHTSRIVALLDTRFLTRNGLELICILTSENGTFEVRWQKPSRVRWTIRSRQLAIPAVTIYLLYGSLFGYYA